jgi:hypothetical protein
MPNVTITVPDELKDKMLKYPEVSWSEICRNAISLYIAQRENPTPRIEVEIRSTRLYPYVIETGYPTLTIDAKIQNKMNTEIVVDRVLATVWARTGGNVFGFGRTFSLHRKKVKSNSAGLATFRVALTKEILEKLKDVFKSSFTCTVDFTVYVDSFEDAYHQEDTFVMPIDTWNNIVATALGENQATE